LEQADDVRRRAVEHLVAELRVVELDGHRVGVALGGFGEDRGEVRAHTSQGTSDAMADEEQEEQENSLKELEEDPPKNLEDWPSDERKYETLGGKEGDHGYDEGPERNLGPSGVRHHDDGSVSI